MITKITAYLTGLTLSFSVALIHTNIKSDEFTEHEPTTIESCSDLYAKVDSILSSTSKKSLAKKLDQEELLHKAAELSCLPTIEKLVQEGADVNHRARTRRLNTPLMIAIIHNKLDSAETLIALGAKTEVQNHSQQMPLFKAVENQNLAMIKLLVEKGNADVNIRAFALSITNEDGLSSECFEPLFGYVVSLGHKELFYYFLDHGADIHAGDPFYGSPLRIALLGGHLEMAHKLFQRGARLTEEEIADIESRLHHETNKYHNLINHKEFLLTIQKDMQEPAQQKDKSTPEFLDTLLIQNFGSHYQEFITSSYRSNKEETQRSFIMIEFFNALHSAKDFVAKTQKIISLFPYFCDDISNNINIIVSDLAQEAYNHENVRNQLKSISDTQEFLDTFVKQHTTVEKATNYLPITLVTGLSTTTCLWYLQKTFLAKKSHTN